MADVCALGDRRILGVSMNGPREGRPAAPEAALPIEGSVATTLLRFTHRLRDSGIPVSMVETIDSAVALRHVDVTDRSAFKAALASTLVKPAEHRPAFDSLFDLYFAIQREGAQTETSLDRAAGPAAAGGPAEPDPDLSSTDILEALLTP